MTCFLYAVFSIFVAFGIFLCSSLWYIPRCLTLASVVEFASQTTGLDPFGTFIWDFVLIPSCSSYIQCMAYKISMNSNL